MLILQAHLIVEQDIEVTLEVLAKSTKYLELNRNPAFTQKVKWIRAFAPLGDDPH